MGVLHRLFGRGEVTPGEVVDRIARLESGLRLLETEQTTMHDQVRRWMRRAVAAERRLDDGAGAREGPLEGEASRLTPPRRNRLNWRDRIEARRAAARAAHEVAPGSTNGGGG